ncbi:hypothetical protein CGH71_22700 [Vibrio parahaemolyticus]|nr:hypothetical protein CGH71_22700 [Vibrio parahaemolyticus]
MNQYLAIRDRALKFYGKTKKGHTLNQRKWLFLNNQTVKLLFSYSSNKAFKSDSQRLVFFIPSLGFVFKVV